MAYNGWQATVQDDAGNAIPLAEITVREGGPSGDIATIYSDTIGAVKANPFFATVTGFAQFFAAPGSYYLTASLDGQTTDGWYVAITSSLTDGFASRAAFIAALGWPWESGAVVSDGTVQYEYLGTGTAISDAPGWVPFGVACLSHFGTRTGTNDGPTISAWWEYIRTILSGAQEEPVDYGVVGVVDTGKWVSASPLYLVADKYYWQIRGDSWSSVLKNVGIEFTFPWGSAENITFVGTGSVTHAIKFNGNETLCNKLHIRGHATGLVMQSGAYSKLTNSKIHRCGIGATYSQSCGGHSIIDTEVTSCTSGGILQDGGGELKMQGVRCMLNSNYGYKVAGNIPSLLVPNESYINNCTFTENGGPVSHTISSILSHASGIEVTFSAPHKLTRGLGKIGLSGTGVVGYDGLLGYVVAVTGSSSVVLNFPFVATASSGVATSPGWDVIFEGATSDTSSARNFHFIGGNINNVKLGDCFNVQFTGVRLKSRIWLERQVNGLVFNRVGFTGEYAGGSTVVSVSQSERMKEIPISGTACNGGWTDLLHTQTGGADYSASDGLRLEMRTPQTGGAVVNYEPSLVIYSGIDRDGHDLTGALNVSGTTTLSGNLKLTNKLLTYGAGLVGTISGGIMSVSNRTVISVDTEASAATDDLDTLSNGVDGQMVILRGRTGSRVPTVRHGTGNIRLAAGVNLALNPRTRLVLFYDAGLVEWNEISRSENI